MALLIWILDVLMASDLPRRRDTMQHFSFLAKNKTICIVLVSFSVEHHTGQTLEGFSLGILSITCLNIEILEEGFCFLTKRKHPLI